MYEYKIVESRTCDVAKNTEILNLANREGWELLFATNNTYYVYYHFRREKRPDIVKGE